MLHWQRTVTVLVFVTLFKLVGSAAANAADWPMWRFDAGRAASSPEELAPEMYLQWIRQYEARRLAWDDAVNQDRMPFDKVFEPIIANGMLFVGFNDADKLAAFDLQTGEERWAFYVDGPVRLPPVAFQSAENAGAWRANVVINSVV